MERKHCFTLIAFAAGAVWFGFRILFLGAEFVFDSSKALLFLILAPVGEELLFRGVIQEYLERRKLPSFFFITSANIAASLLFVFFHLLGNEPLHAFAVFLPSVIFGVLYSEYRSVWISILCHSFYNFNVMFV